jgi:hypothetical protein
LYTALSENNASLERQVQARTVELEEKNKLLGAAKEAAEKATRIKADFLSNMSQSMGGGGRAGSGLSSAGVVCEC